MSSFLFEIYRNPALDEVPKVVTSAATTMYAWKLINPNEETVYLKLYNSAAPTVGTTAPLTIIPVPAGDGTNPGIYEKSDLEPYRRFSSALSVAVVTGLADSDTTAPTVPVYLELVWL